jgi:acyl-CoA thioester hydrolase
VSDPNLSRVTTPYEGLAHASWNPDSEIPAPLRLHRTPVLPEWLDYNGHMSESCYLLVFGDSADAFFRFIGIDEAYRATGHSLYTSETHLHHRREAAESEPLELTLQVLDHDGRRLHIFHEMQHGETGLLLASAEQLLVHVDMATGRSSELPADVYERIAAIRDAHAVLPRPDVVGRAMGIRHRSPQSPHGQEQ